MKKYFMTMQNTFSGLLSMEKKLAYYSAVYEHCVLTDEEVDVAVARLKLHQEKLLKENPRWKEVSICRSTAHNGDVFICIGHYSVHGIKVEELMCTDLWMIKEKNGNVEIAHFSETGPNAISVRWQWKGLNAMRRLARTLRIWNSWFIVFFTDEINKWEVKITTPLTCLSYVNRVKQNMRTLWKSVTLDIELSVCQEDETRSSSRRGMRKSPSGGIIGPRSSGCGSMMPWKSCRSRSSFFRRTESCVFFART